MVDLVYFPTDYFPELARQKRLLDRKHQGRRRNYWNKVPRKEREKDEQDEEDAEYEPRWEENEAFEENDDIDEKQDENITQEEQDGNNTQEEQDEINTQEEQDGNYNAPEEENELADAVLEDDTVAASHTLAWLTCHVRHVSCKAFRAARLVKEFLLRYIRDRFVAQKRIIDLLTNVESNYVKFESGFLVFTLF